MNAFRLTTAVFVVGGLFLAATSAYTVPRYSARYQQDCNLCHFSPTGGGQRSAYATQFIVPREMAMTVPTDEEMEMISPQLSDAVTVGADLRTFFFSSNLDSPTGFRLGRGPSENFFQMQGNVYVSFQLTKRLSAHFSQGISSSYELYGLAYVLPANGYFKVGRFVPDFGWRFADHTSFVRDYGRFFPPLHTDVGLEAGITPGSFTITAGVMNGQPGSTRDLNDKPAVMGKALYRWHVGGVGAALGGSIHRHEDPGGTRTVGGPLGYLQTGPLTWVWEFDFERRDTTGAGLATGAFATNELTYRVVQGLDLRGTFDFYDPDTDADTGRRYRYGIGGQVMPYPFLVLDGAFNLYRNEEGAGIPEPEYNQLVLQVHFFY